MADEIVRLEGGVLHTSWNYCCQRMAAGTFDGFIQIWDPGFSGSPDFALSKQWKAHSGPVSKVVWAPPEFGDVVASCSTDGVISLWEEVKEGRGGCSWILCTNLEENSVSVLDVQFGNGPFGLLLVAACADGNVKVYETSDVLGLKQWQLQAELKNMITLTEKVGKCTCTSASISWRPNVDAFQPPVFVLGYNCSSPPFRVAKIWEFVEPHQRWHCIMDLKLPDEGNDPVHHVSWAPNIGRPYEMIAVASGNGVSIWHVDFSALGNDRNSPRRVAWLQSFDREVLHVDWDMTGMILATSGSDGVVRLWQANIKGDWQQQACIRGQ